MSGNSKMSVMTEEERGRATRDLMRLHACREQVLAFLEKVVPAESILAAAGRLSRSEDGVFDACPASILTGEIEAVAAVGPVLARWCAELDGLLDTLKEIRLRTRQAHAEAHGGGLDGLMATLSWSGSPGKCSDEAN